MQTTPPASSLAAAPSLGEGRYALTEVIGEGGMSVVYRGWDHRLHVERAIKVLSREASERSGVLERFRAEAQTAARLHHPHIVSALDIVEEGGRCAIVMELVRGGTLWERVERRGPLSEAEAARLLLPVVEAVGAAHRAGVVHRDIKPQNILLTERGAAKLSDFGIALVEGDALQGNLTRTGAVLGTFGYMSPEQRTDASRVSAASDLYALGATLWAVVRGRSPTDLFAADLEPRLLDGLSPPLAALVRDCTRYRMEDRPADAETLAQRLEALLDSLPIVPTAAPAARGAEALSSGGGRPEAGTLHDLLQDEPARAPSATQVWQQVRAEHGHVRAEPARPRRWLPWALVTVLLGALGFTLYQTVSLAELLAEAVQAPEPPVAPPRPKRSGPSSRGPTAATGPSVTGPSVGPTAGPAEPPSETAAGPTEPGLGPTGGPADIEGAPEPAAAPALGGPTAAPPPTAAIPSVAAPEPLEGPRAAPWAPPTAVEPPPLLAMGRVSFSGPVIDPELEADNGEVYSPGVVPAGRYRVRGAFGAGKPRGVIAEITVEADVEVRLRCDGVFQKCSP